MTIKGIETLSGNFGEYGTKESGFAEGGPFSCLDCVHRDVVGKRDVCTHPTVNDDKQLKDRDRAGGYVVIGYSDCCRFVRPEKE